MPSVKDSIEVKTFADIVRILRSRPEWLEEMRRLILTDELLQLPKKFDAFVKEDFRPLKKRVDKIEEDVAVLKQDVAVLKQDVEILKQDVAILKQDVAVLKQDVAALKGSDFERTVRERAPAYLGRIIRRCRVINFEDLADRLEDGVEAGRISDEEKNDALLIDVIAQGIIKPEKKVLLAVEVSLKVDVEDVERASKRADVIYKAMEMETIPVALGKETSQKAREKADKMGVFVI